jgi:protein-S-isoprenylcysteine O-methyltransferase Ste14
MDTLTKKTLTGLARWQAALAAMIFIPAWSIEYWEGWLYWLVSLACNLVVVLYFLKHDPALIARRMHAGPKAEREAKQKLILSFGSVALPAIFVVSGLDHVFGWSSMPWPLAVVGDVFVIISYVIFFIVFRENSFASSIIEVAPGQTVVTTGPYARVRHPMYSGAIFFLLGTPLALRSWWAFLPAVLVLLAVVWRLLDEENYLSRNLPRYDDYRRGVRWRLLPGVW